MFLARACCAPASQPRCSLNRWNLRTTRRFLSLKFQISNSASWFLSFLRASSLSCFRDGSFVGCCLAALCYFLRILATNGATFRVVAAAHVPHDVIIHNRAVQTGTTRWQSILRRCAMKRFVVGIGLLVVALALSACIVTPLPPPRPRPVVGIVVEERVVVQEREHDHGRWHSRDHDRGHD